MSTIKDAPFPAFSGGKSQSLSQRLDAFGAVNAAEMPNFAGDGTTDDIIPLRAAVAKALADGKGAVVIPPGATCAISDTLGLWFEADQTNPAFSMALVSPGPHGNHNGYGSVIKPTFDGTALMVGPGQEMLVQNIAVIDTGASYRGLQDSSRIGIGISGGSGGASGWSLINCHVYGMHTAVKSGMVDAALCDSGMIQKLNVDSCAVGVDYTSTQNYIQSLVGCTITATTAVSALIGHNVNIIGGNLSAPSGEVGIYTLSSVSGLTRTADGNGATYTFTATVTNPDANLVGGILPDGALNLPHFGVVGVTLIDYNVGTQVVTLQILRMWGLFHYQDVNLKTATDFDTINQANTALVLAERLTTLHGTGFNVTGLHLENASGYTRFLESHVGFDAGTHITNVNGLYCNWDPAQPQDGVTARQNAKRLVQKAHPFINLFNGGAVIDGMRFSQASNAALNFDMENANLLKVTDWRSLKAPNVRCYIGQNPFVGGSYEFYGGSGVGAGIWEPTPFVPLTLTSANNAIQRSVGWNRGEYWGWFPGKDRTPRLAPSQVTTLSGTLPTFTTGNDTGYPLLCGGTHYSIGSEVESNSGAAHLLRSDHKGFSHGQNLTTTNVANLAWSFYGKTTKLVINTEAFQRVFPGLVLSLSHASINSGAAFEVMITGTHYEELYIDIAALSGWVLPGTAGTQYTGTTIGQAAYSITTV